jgi:hypothetical protein
LDRYKCDVNGELASVVANEVEIRVGAQLPRARVSGKVTTVSDMGPSVWRGHKDLDCLTDQFVAGVTGHLHEEFVYVADDSAFVDKCASVWEHIKPVMPRDSSIIQMIHDVSNSALRI